MAINPDLLVSAAIMQDYFVDNVTGQAMAGGIITMYQDNARTVLKNWYYQTGSPGAYTYLPLNNPLILSSVGTITDPSGQDTIPFYYPFDENDQTVSQPYYVTVVDSNLQNQFTRENFPSHTGAGGGGGGGNNTQLTNIIANNVFYHPITINSAFDLTNETNRIIAPSQHDGFMAAAGNDFRFLKNVTGATDHVTFIPFPQGAVPMATKGQQTPALYCNLECSAIQAGETTKAIQVPLNINVQTMDSLFVTFSIWAQRISGSDTLSINFKFYAGTGAAPSASVFTPLQTFHVTTSWDQYIFSVQLPTASGIAKSGTGDDAVYLFINFPLSQQFSINITKPALYIGTISPTIITALPDFTTNDQIDQIISSPRTGDVRVSLNDFAPWGWALCNDGTIGNAGSGANFASIDTWNLFYLIWTAVNSNTFAPIFTSAGAGSTYGASAYADWTANKRLSLTKQLGRAIASQGIASVGGVTTWALGQSTNTAEEVTLSRDQMAQHTHDPLSGQFLVTGSTSVFLGGGAIATQENTTAGITGYAGPTPVSLMQPTMFYNVFLKL